MEMTTAQKLQMYINEESGAAALYRELAKVAPNDEYAQLLLEFAEDEQGHADTFRKIYRSMTGRSYTPEIRKPQLMGDFYDILHERILDESGDYRKYGEQYLLTTNNDMLKEAYYRARTDENVHALRLLYMLTGFEEQA